MDLEQTLKNHFHIGNNQSFTVEEIEAMEKELAKLSCFKELLHNKTSEFEQCKEIAIKELLNSMRVKPEINRDYLIGFQDAYKAFDNYLNRFYELMEQQRKGVN